jgi:GNAT superfamily N-acetyltransferase
MDEAVPAEIRLARLDECEGIAALLDEAFREHRPEYTTGAYAATTPTAETLRGRFDEGPVWVALRGGEIVGTVAAVIREGSLYVRSMAVLPTARGGRIGTRLLDRAEEYARVHGITRLYLSTTPFLHRAISLYRSYGFGFNGEEPDLHGTPLRVMEKWLLTAEEPKHDEG